MARTFDGTDDKLELASALVTAPALSFSCLFYANSLAAHGTLISIHNTADAGEFRLLLRTTGALRMRSCRNDGTADSAQTTATVSTGSWNHAAGVIASTSSRSAYLNGANKVSASVSITTPTGLNATVIGASSAATNEFINGMVAEVGIWNVALTDAEVASLGQFISPRFIRPQSLIEYIPIMGSYSPEIGLKGNLFTLTGTTKADHPRIHIPASPVWIGRAGAGAPPPTRRIFVVS